MHDQVSQREIATLVYHELRAPLGLVVTAARAASGEDDPEELRRQCAIIQRTAERMLRTAAAVIESARATRSPEPAWFLPQAQLDSAVQDAAVSGMPVSLACDAGAANLEAYGSPAQFEALFHSLLANAMDHGDPAAGIAVATGIEDGRFIFAVRNAVAAHPRHRGLGVGTALCQQLAAALGGELCAEQRDGDFIATFRVPAIERIALRGGPMVTA